MTFRAVEYFGLLWVAVLGVVTFGTLSVADPPDDSSSMPGIEAQKAFALINERFPGTEADGADARFVFVAPDGQKGTSAANRSAIGEAENLGARWARFVLRRPVPVLIVSVVGLGAVALPAMDLRMGMPGDEAKSTATTERRAHDALAADGRSNTEIAAELFLSPLTVRTHIQRAKTKLGARDRAQLVVFAYRSGLVRPPRRGSRRADS
ncbi:LuxR C-terminal-related transcriptional regulator [Streptomyces sp. NPDC020766]|uniref:response regulator transcription factor n=1 Tax=Streptomyces sp. NPDC020766 TaxID=3155011 RepID=UPI0033F2170E